MLDQSRAPQNNHDTPVVRRRRFILCTLTVVFAAAILFLGAYAKYTGERADTAPYAVQREIIRGTFMSAYQSTVIDPHTRQQYVYQAHLRLPAAGWDHENLMYTHDPASKDFDATITFTLPGAIQKASELLPTDSSPFSAAQDFQRCSKLFVVQFHSDMDIEASFVKSKTILLADGRTAYLYKNTSCDTLCHAIEKQVNAAEAALQQIESYEPR